MTSKRKRSPGATIEDSAPHQSVTMVASSAVTSRRGLPSTKVTVNTEYITATLIYRRNRRGYSDQELRQLNLDLFGRPLTFVPRELDSPRKFKIVDSFNTSNLLNPSFRTTLPRLSSLFRSHRHDDSNRIQHFIVFRSRDSGNSTKHNSTINRHARERELLIGSYLEPRQSSSGVLVQSCCNLCGRGSKCIYTPHQPS